MRFIARDFNAEPPMQSRPLSTASRNAHDAPLARSSAPMAYSIESAAEESSTSRDTIYRAIRNGDLKARKIGSRTVICSCALVAASTRSTLPNATTSAARN